MSKSHPRWRMAKRVLTVLFFIAVVVLLVVYAQKVDWEEVWKVIRNYNRMVLLGAVGLVIVSYLMYGCYDLLGRAYCGHKLAKRQVMLVSFICYAFNLTLSTWVGGIGMRYRLYSRLGLPGGTITRIFSLSITTNWLGYILLGGVIFTIGVVQLPAHWYIDEATLRILGIVLLLIIAFYLWACAFAKRRHMTLRGQKLVLPSWKFAMLQMAVSSANWMAMGAIIWLLIGEDVNYFFVLGVLLVSSIAGVIVHIPAGIGVLEAVFIALLAGEHVSQGTIIAALLAYRMLYYFLPLALAIFLADASVRHLPVSLLVSIGLSLLLAAGYWLIALGQAVFGQNLFGVRIASALTTGLSVLLAYLIARRLWNDPRKSFACALVYMTFGLIAGQAGYSNLDPQFTLWVNLSLVALWFALDSTPLRRRLGAWAVVGLACALVSAPARAQSEASAALSLLPVASVVGTASVASAAAGAVVTVPAALSVGGAVLTVRAVEASAVGTVYLLERASDGAQVSVEVVGRGVAGSAYAVGTVVTCSVIGTGVILSAAGEAIAFVPNAIGRALLHNERL